MADNGLAAQADEIMRALQEVDSAPAPMRGIDIIAALEMDPNLTLDDVLGSRPDPQTLAGTGPAPRARGALLPVPLPDLPSRSPNAVEFGEGLQPQSAPEARELAQDASSFGRGANVVATTAAMHPIGRAVSATARGAAALTAPVARHVASHPAAYGLATTAGLTTAGAADTQPPTPDEADARQLNDLTKQLGELQGQRRLALEEMRAQREGSGGRGAGMGPRYKAQEEGVARLDTQITTLNDTLTQVRTRMTPEYRDMRRRLQEADDERQRILGAAPKPFREEYPNLTKMWFAIPIAAGALEAALLRMPKALSLQGQAQRWWEAVNTARTSTNPIARANSRILAERLEQAMPEPTKRSIAGFYAGPALAAGLSGAGVANLPEFYDLFTLPAINPERRAYEEYLKRLPNNHPEVQRTVEMLRSIPQDNPHYQAALRHFAEIKPFIVKAVEGAIEGIGGAALITSGAKAISPWESSLPRAETRALLDSAALRSRRTPQSSQGPSGSTEPIPLSAERQPALLAPPSRSGGNTPPAARAGDAPRQGPAPTGQGPGGGGARETWVSPSGETKFIDATGRWQNREGFTNPPDPRKWRRISSIHDNTELFAGYPVT